jgi:hypothetical protein
MAEHTAYIWQNSRTHGIHLAEYQNTQHTSGRIAEHTAYIWQKRRMAE